MGITGVQSGLGDTYDIKILIIPNTFDFIDFIKHATGFQMSNIKKFMVRRKTTFEFYIGETTASCGMINII